MFSAEKIRKVQEKITSNILSNIAENGLLPRKSIEKLNKPCIGSADSSLNGLFGVSFNNTTFGQLANNAISQLCVNHMELAKSPRFDLKYKLRDLIFQESAGAFPIALEREYKLVPSLLAGGSSKEKASSLQLEFAKRAEKSIFLILKPIENFKGVAKGVYPKDIDAVVFEEKRLTSGISADNIIGIICAQSLMDVVKSIFPKASVYPVSLTEERVLIPFFETQKYWPSYNKDMELKLSVPNYVAGITQFLQKNPLKTFDAHLVRLPTELDIQHGLQNKFPLYLGEYQKENQVEKEKQIKEQIEKQKKAAIKLVHCNVSF